MPPRAKGTYAIKQQKARKRTTSDTKSYVIPYVGPYTALEAAEPPINSSVAGFPAEYKVSDVSLEDTGGGSGRMVVTIEWPKPPEGSGGSTEQLADPIYESDYIEDRRPLEENKKCGYLNSERGYYEYPDRKTSTANPSKTASEADADAEKVYKQRTWDHWQSLDADDYVESTATGKWTLAQYKALREAGFDSYPISLPICTVTSYHRFRPTPGGSINSVDAPNSNCNPPSGYIYVKTTDKITKQGRLYTRVQGWKGYAPGQKSDVFI